jgi:hypothetical protein
MTDAVPPPSVQRDRSPAYPNIPLKAAIERLVEFDAHFKRSPARPEKIGEAWGIKGKAYVDRTTAALRYYGLLEYQGGGKDRYIVTSDWGKAYLRSAQEETKQTVIKKAALLPKQIAFFWSQWGTDRPADAACLDDLMFKHKFGEAGARDFLKVYDATISYAGLTSSDKPDPIAGARQPEEEDAGGEAQEEQNPPPPPPLGGKVKVMAGERELTTGMLAKDASFRLIVSGNIGVKEIERLIQKLEIDKEILADEDGAPSDDDIADANQRDRSGQAK